MATVTLTIETFNSTPLPTGVKFGEYEATIFASDGITVVQQMKGAGPSFVFPSDVSPGSYVGAAIALDSNGNNLGTEVISGFTVPTPATFEAPATITVSLS